MCKPYCEPICNQTMTSGYQRGLTAAFQKLYLRCATQLSCSQANHHGSLLALLLSCHSTAVMQYLAIEIAVCHVLVHRSCHVLVCLRHEVDLCIVGCHHLGCPSTLLSWHRSTVSLSILCIHQTTFSEMCKTTCLPGSVAAKFQFYCISSGPATVLWYSANFTKLHWWSLRQFPTPSAGILLIFTE